MLRRLILARIASAEKDWGVSLEYCRFILRVSLRAFFKFAKFLAVDEYRRVLPPGPCYVARIVAVGDEDCGTDRLHRTYWTPRHPFMRIAPGGRISA